MGTEILQPQDLLAQRFGINAPPPFHGRRNFPADGDLTRLIVNRRPTNNSYRKKSPKPEKRKSNETKRVFHGGDARRNVGSAAAPPVTILRRGQSFDSLAGKTSKSPPEKSVSDDITVVPKQIRLAPPPLTDVYAGSAFFMSPSPRSLPVPSFTNKRPQVLVKVNPADDPATRDLRRLLRLE